MVKNLSPHFTPLCPSDSEAWELIELGWKKKKGSVPANVDGSKMLAYYVAQHHV